MRLTTASMPLRKGRPAKPWTAGRDGHRLAHLGRLRPVVQGAWRSVACLSPRGVLGAGSPNADTPMCSKCRRPHSAAECGDRRPLTSMPLGAGSQAGSPPPPPPPPPPPHSLEGMLVGSPADRTVQLLGTVAWIIMHALSS